MNDMKFCKVEEKIIKDVFKIFVDNDLNVDQCEDILSCVSDELCTNTRIIMPE